MPQDDSDEAWLTQATRHWQSPSSDGSWPDVSAVVAEGNTEQLHAHHINNLPPAILHGIFSHLGPRELCAVSATCALWRQLNQDKCANGVWKNFYTSRWRVLDASGEDVCWQTKYGSKMKQGKSWSGKYESDNLWGHKAGVKALKLLPSQGVLLTGSLDRTIRLWDLTYGMPLSISRPHGGTVRAVALDNTLVASGSSDNVVRLWHARNSTNGATLLDPAEASAAAATAGLDLGLAESLMELDGPADSDDQATASDQARAGSSSGGLTAAAVAAVNASTSSRRRAGHGPYSVITGEADEGLFDLSMPGQHLRGHIGPVTSLCLTDSCLYSGSWDYSVRIWRRGSWDCVSVLKYPDWVYSVVAHGGLLLVASGPEVHVHDLPTGKLVRKFQNLHEGSVSCLEGTQSGRLLFSGGADGLLMAHDLRMKEASRVLWHHNAGVNGLALEDPWLVSAASDGTVIMHNLEAALPNNFSGCVGPGSGSNTAGASSSSSSTSKRTLGCPGQSGPMYCVDIAESWLAAGGESPSVRTWDFTRAAEAAARAAAARASRGSSKRAAKMRKAATAATASSTAGAGSSNGASGVGAVTAGCKGQSGKKANKSNRTAGGISSAVASSSAAGGAAASSAGGASAVAAGGSSSRLPRGLLAAAAAAASNAANTLASTPPDSGAAGSSSRADRFHKLQSRRSSSKQLLQQDCAGSSAGATGQQQGSGVGTAEAAASTGELPGSAVGSLVGASSSGSHHARRNSRQHANSSSGGSSNKGSSSYGSSPSGRWQQYNGGGSCAGGGSNYHGGCGSSPVQHGVWLGGTSPPVGSNRLHQTSSGRRGGNSGQGPMQQGGGRPGIPIPAARQSQQQHRLSGAQAECTAGSYEQGRHPHAASPTGADSGASPCYTAASAGAVGAQHARGPRAGAHAGFAGDRCGGYHGAGCTDADSSLVGPSAARYHVPFSSSYPSAAQGPGPWLVPGSSPRYEVWGTTLRIAAATNCDKRLVIKRPEGAARKSSDGGAGAAGEDAPVSVASGSISN